MGVAIGVDSWLKIVFIKSKAIFGSPVLKEEKPFSCCHSPFFLSTLLDLLGQFFLLVTRQVKH